MDVHQADDLVFPKSVFVHLIEGHMTQSVVQDEVGDRDETVTDSHRISASEWLAWCQNIDAIRKGRQREISESL